jgi:predicted secreted protein
MLSDTDLVSLLFKTHPNPNDLESDPMNIEVIFQKQMKMNSESVQANYFLL